MDGDYLGHMGFHRSLLALCALVLLAVPLRAQKKAKAKRTPTYEERFEQIHTLIDNGQFQVADSLLAAIMSVLDSPRAYFERARIDIRRNDSTSYCRDLKEATRMQVDAIDKMYKEHCVMADSGYFSKFYLDSALYPGMVEVKRFRYRANTNISFVLFDEQDTARVGFTIEGPDTLYGLTAEPPEFPGGMEAMYRFMAEHHRYPDMEFEANIQGRVVVRFTIETDGSLSNIRLDHRVSPGLDAEALRMVRAMPMWTAASLNGKAVRFGVTLPVVFVLK